MSKHSEVGSLHGLFLLHEGLPPTVIESRVVGHALAMQKAGVSMEIWSFALNAQAYKQAQGRLQQLTKPGVPVRVFRGVKSSWPCSEIVNATLLAYQLWSRSYSPDFIHARTEYSAAVASTLKRVLSFRLIWDARGDTANEYKAAHSASPFWKRWLSSIVLKRIYWRLDRAAKHADHVIFCSDVLRMQQGKSVGLDKVTVIPNSADNELFFYDPEVRVAVRSSLGLSDDQIVIAYAGSVAPWQCIAETIALMVKAINDNGQCRGVVVTDEPDYFERLIPQNIREKFTVTSCTLKEMNGFLNAADIGVMLRVKSPISWAASPVKFAEYSLAGLKIVTNQTVEQVNSIGALIGNLVDLTAFEGMQLNVGTLGADRVECAQRALEICGKRLSLAEMSRIYQLNQ